MAPYDANEDPLVTAKKNLTARANELEQSARKPWNQIMNHVSAQKDLDEATNMRLKINEIDKQIQQQKDMQGKAKFRFFARFRECYGGSTCELLG